MSAPLVTIDFPSIYKGASGRTSVPERMARCSPDMKKALFGLADAVRQRGGVLRLSDLFRSYDMQFQAHLDYASGKKKAFSPLPGGSMHEAGRAFDLDLAALKIGLAEFWELSKGFRVVPIIATPSTRSKEAWHFECRGSHQLVYEHYRSGTGSNFSKPATAMAASAIVSAGISVDFFKGKDEWARVQSALIRLGHASVGNIDGDVGPKTRGVLETLGVAGDASEILAALNEKLQAKFPEEWFDRTPLDV